MKSPLFHTARQFHAWDANVTAIRAGRKQPLHTWKHLLDTRQTFAELSSYNWPIAAGVGVINGLGGWRTFDIDGAVDDRPLRTLLQALGLPDDYAWAWRSGSGEGWAVAIRCEEALPPGILPAKHEDAGVFWGWPTADASTFHHIELRWAQCQTIYPPSCYTYTKKGDPRFGERGPGYQWHGAAPSEPPALVSVARMINAFFAVAPPPPPTLGSVEEQVKAAIRDRFDLIAYAQQAFGGELQRESGGEVRVLGHGGLLVNPDKQTWFNHSEQLGGDCFDLVAYATYRTTVKNLHGKSAEILQHTADVAGVRLPQRTTPRVDPARRTPTEARPVALPMLHSFPALPAAAQLAPQAAAGACDWLDRYIDFSRRWSPRSFDGFHTATALWLLSTIAARRVALHFGKVRYPSLYIALTSRTSLYAKSSAAEIGSATLAATGLRHLLAPDDSTPQAFISTLATRLPKEYALLSLEQQHAARQRLAFAAQKGWFYDEFGQKLSAMMKDGGFMADFRGLLRRFDDCPLAYEYATIGRGSDVVQQPYLALLANMTPADVQPFARRGAALGGDGFFARFAFITPPPDAPRLRGRFPPGERIIPQAIIEPLVCWHERLGIPDVLVTTNKDEEGKPTGRDDLSVMREEPQWCTFGEGVLDAFYTYHEALLDLIEAGVSADLDGNYTRLAEKALRIAMLLASLENDGRIELRHWARAQQITESWREMLHHLVDQLAQAEPSADSVLEERVITLLERQPSWTARDVGRHLHISTAEATHMLESLVRAGAVAVRHTGRTTLYELLIPSRQQVQRVADVALSPASQPSHNTKDAEVSHDEVFGDRSDSATAATAAELDWLTNESVAAVALSPASQPSHLPDEGVELSQDTAFSDRSDSATVATVAELDWPRDESVADVTPSQASQGSQHDDATYAEHTTQPQLRVDLNYVRHLLAIGDEASLKAVRVHCILRRVDYDAVVAATEKEIET